MAKSTATYWNVLAPENADKWELIPGTSGMLEQLTLAVDEKIGDYTRLTRFKSGADTTEFGGKSHTYPEEIYIISGKLYDAAFDQWLEAGDFASDHQEKYTVLLFAMKSVWCWRFPIQANQQRTHNKANSADTKSRAAD